MANKAKKVFLVSGIIIVILSGVYVDNSIKAEERAYQEKMAPLVQKSDEIKSNFVKKQVGMVSKGYFTAIHEVAAEYKERAKRNFYTVTPGKTVDPDVFYSYAYHYGEVSRKVDSINPSEYLPTDLKDMFLMGEGTRYIRTNKGEYYVGVQQGTYYTYTRDSSGDYVGETKFAERATTHNLPDKTFAHRTRWSYNSSLGVLEKVYKTNSGDFLSLVIPSRTNIGYTVSSPNNSFIIAVDPYLWKNPSFGETLKVAYYNPKTDTRINYFFAKGKGCVVIEEFPDEGVSPRKSPLWYETIKVQYAEKWEKV